MRKGRVRRTASARKITTALWIDARGFSQGEHQRAVRGVVRRPGAPERRANVHLLRDEVSFPATPTTACGRPESPSPSTPG